MTHGFVQNLARPGGNATGFTIMEPTTTGKWLEPLKEIAPRSNRAALLFNPATAPYASIYLNPFKAAAASLGLEPIAATSIRLAAQRSRRTDRDTSERPADIISLAARYRLPAIYPWRFFAEEGGSTTVSSAIFRLARPIVDRIFKGAKPDNLPAQALIVYKPVINLKTVASRGLVVPPALLDRGDLADRVADRFCFNVRYDLEQTCALLMLL